MIFFMPQMSPMMWLILSFFNMINMIMMMIYLNSLPINLQTEFSLVSVKNKYKWDWEW